MRTLQQQIALADPRERLAATLERLDDTIHRARQRVRSWGHVEYADPDTQAILKCEEFADKLLREYHARTLSSVESIGTLDRAQACAELRAVLEAWEDPGVSDEQWRASRRASTPIEVAPRGSVKRRAKPSL